MTNERGRGGSPQHLFDLTLDALSAWFESRKLSAYRARQVMEWVYRHGATSFEVMTNLSAKLREDLAGQLAIYLSTVAADQHSHDGTRKMLLRWPDGATSECVLIPEPDRNTACISSQVGCPVQCTFCASGIGGLERQLTAGQIVEQAMRVGAVCAGEAGGESPDYADHAHYADREGSAETPSLRAGVPRGAAAHGHPDAAAAFAEQRRAAPRNRSRNTDAPAEQRTTDDGGRTNRLTNIVFMGIGEPLANYKAVVAAVRTLNAPWGMNIGARKITVSTVGLPKQIRQLADEGLQFNLAISLHAASDDLRRRLIPWAQRVSISELVDAARYYFERTGREVTLEYVMLGGVNTRPVDVQRLAHVTKQMRCNVNLIPYNPVAGQPYERPDDSVMRDFLRGLRDHGVNAHIRRSRGLDIDAACGQLREQHRI
jgi:23S rRNA (adenine2503-C2)-methyltransferase